MCIILFTENSLDVGESLIVLNQSSGFRVLPYKHTYGFKVSYKTILGMCVINTWVYNICVAALICMVVVP
jgi:hypothetical protein